MRGFLFCIIFQIVFCGLSIGQVNFYKGSQEGILKLTNGVLDNSTVNYSINLNTPTFSLPLAPNQYGIPEKVLYKFENTKKISTWVVEIKSDKASSLDIV